MGARRGFRRAPQIRRKINTGEFKNGHNANRGRGRPAGSVNRLPASVKEMVLEAVRLCGDDGKGRNGAIGFLTQVARTEPALMVRLLEKILPTQVTGANEGPLKVMALPPEVMSKLGDKELAVMEAIYSRLAGGTLTAAAQEPEGDADAYAKSIGETRH